MPVGLELVPMPLLASGAFDHDHAVAHGNPTLRKR